VWLSRASLRELRGSEEGRHAFPIVSKAHRMLEAAVKEGAWVYRSVTCSPLAASGAHCQCSAVLGKVHSCEHEMHTHGGFDTDVHLYVVECAFAKACSGAEVGTSCASTSRMINPTLRRGRPWLPFPPRAHATFGGG
jgi:hypothetical protein